MGQVLGHINIFQIKITTRNTTAKRLYMRDLLTQKVFYNVNNEVMQRSFLIFHENAFRYRTIEFPASTFHACFYTQVRD